MLSSIAVQPTVSTPFLRWFGLAALAGGVLVAGILAFGGAWLGAFFCLTMFGGCGAALYLMSATVSGDDHGLTISKPHTRRTVPWSDVTGVGVGGGNLVLKLSNMGRAVGPAPEFWYGSHKAQLIDLMFARLKANGVEVDVSCRAMFQAGDRR